MLSLPSTLGQASGASVVQYKGFARIPEGREHDLVTANQTANELLVRGREIEMRLVVSPYGIEGSTTKTLSKMPKKPQGILRKVMSPIPRETTNMQTVGRGGGGSETSPSATLLLALMDHGRGCN